MGGHAAPARAAAEAVAAARETLAGSDRPLAERVHAAVVAANARVRALATADPKAPGATLTVALIAGETLYLARVGDGAAFLARGERIERLTRTTLLGHTPPEYLGRADDVAIETHQRLLRPGDRVLLCTDGLLRALGGEPVPAAITETLARRDATPDSRVAQLLAAAREADYDDDTTLVLLEVVAIAPEPSISSARMPTRRMSIPWLVAGGALSLALGFLVGRVTAPGTPAAVLSAAPPGPPASTLPAADAWPEAPVLLLDDIGRRLLVLRTAAPPPPRPGQPLRLQGLRLGPDGRIARTGRFELDVERRLLTDSQGRARPVDIDWESGVVTVLRGATLVVQSRPSGAEVFIDDRRAGVTPARLRLAMGRHSLRVHGPGWTHESVVVLPPGQVVTLSVGPE